MSKMKIKSFAIFEALTAIEAQRIAGALTCSINNFFRRRDQNVAVTSVNVLYVKYYESLIELFEFDLFAVILRTTNYFSFVLSATMERSLEL
jgi:hypothetical protein